jgi:hypothetical protein
MKTNTVVTLFLAVGLISCRLAPTLSSDLRPINTTTPMAVWPSNHATATITPSVTPFPTFTETAIPPTSTLIPTSIPDSAFCLLNQDQVPGFLSIQLVIEKKLPSGIYDSFVWALVPAIDQVNNFMVNHIYVSSNAANLQWPALPHQATRLPPPNVGDSAIAYQYKETQGGGPGIEVDFKRGNALATVAMYQLSVDEDVPNFVALNNVIELAKIVDECLQSISPYPQLISIPPQDLDTAAFNQNFSFMDIGQMSSDQFVATTTLMRNQDVCVQYSVINPELLMFSVHWYILDDLTQTIIYHWTQPVDSVYYLNAPEAQQNCFMKMESPGKFHLLLYIDQTLTKVTPYTVH